MSNEQEEDRWDPIQLRDRWGLHARTHLTVLLIVIIAESIGTIEYSIGPGTVVLLPLLYAVVMGITLSYSVLGQRITPLRRFISKEVSTISTPLLVIALMPLGVKYGTLVGPSFNELISAGPAFLLQELGNLGTILLALPLALLLGLKREAIGGAVSIAREPTLGIITDKYGIESPEGRGVLGTYLTGTILGTIFFGLLGGFATATGLSPLALAMACGIGSASMMTACSASLAEAVPNSAVSNDQILSFAATSNLLTGITGLYVVLFIGLPFINKLYGVLAPRIQGEDAVRSDDAMTDGGRVVGLNTREFGLNSLAMLIVVGILTVVANYVGYDISPLAAVPGMVLIIGIGLVSLFLGRYAPLELPSFAYAILIAFLFVLPFSPVQDVVLGFTEQVEFLATTTPILAYAGLSVGLQVRRMRDVSWKLVIVAVFVFFGTFFGSALIAQAILSAQVII